MAHRYHDTSPTNEYIRSTVNWLGLGLIAARESYGPRVCEVRTDESYALRGYTNPNPNPNP